MPISTEADIETVRRIRAYLSGKGTEKIPAIGGGKLQVLQALGFKAVKNELVYRTALAISLPEEIVMQAKDGEELKKFICAQIMDLCK